MCNAGNHHRRAATCGGRRDCRQRGRQPAGVLLCRICPLSRQSCFVRSGSPTLSLPAQVSMSRGVQLVADKLIRNCGEEEFDAIALPVRSVQAAVSNLSARADSSELAFVTTVKFTKLCMCVWGAETALPYAGADCMLFLCSLLCPGCVCLWLCHGWAGRRRRRGAVARLRRAGSAGGRAAARRPALGGHLRVARGGL